jgi:hypothetical protein
MNQQDLADSIGISKNTLYNYDNHDPFYNIYSNLFSKQAYIRIKQRVKNDRFATCRKEKEYLYKQDIAEEVLNNIWEYFVFRYTGLIY